MTLLREGRFLNITLTADDLLLRRNYKSTSLVFKILFRNFHESFKAKQVSPLYKVITFAVAKKTYLSLRIYFYDLKCFFAMSHSVQFSYLGGFADILKLN